VSAESNLAEDWSEADIGDGHSFNLRCAAVLVWRM
jgi:hypothetical protein